MSWLIAEEPGIEMHQKQTETGVELSQMKTDLVAGM